MRHGVFVAEHHAFQQYTDCLIKTVHVDLGKFAADAAISGIVEENIEPAELADRMCDEVLHLFLMRDIGAAIGEVLSQFALHCLALMVLQVGGNDFRAFLQKQIDRATTYAARAAGDDGDLAVQTSHDALPDLFVLMGLCYPQQGRKEKRRHREADKGGRGDPERHTWRVVLERFAALAMTRAYLPLNTGFLFSMKAARPSL